MKKGGLSIVVVDDDPEIREVLELALGAEGYSVEVAKDRNSATEIILKTNPSVILLDYYMNGINADDFIADLRGRAIATPIILMTGAHDAADKAKELGLRYVLPKPFDLDALLDLVRTCEPCLPN